MGLSLPTPTVTPGPTYATMNNAAFEVVDSHNHTLNNGVPIPSAGILLDADLPFNGYNGTLFRSVRFQSQSSPLSLSNDLACLYSSGGELYYNDGSANQVKITLNGAVNTSQSGTITGMGATTASASYNSTSETFSFLQNTNQYANFAVGPLRISDTAANAPGITLKSPTSLSSAYVITLPTALPSSTQLLTSDSSGNLSYSPVVTQFLPNYLINGAFDIWQRTVNGTTTSTAIDNPGTLYFPDRWYVQHSLVPSQGPKGTNGEITISKVAGTVVGSKYGCQLQITIAPTNSPQNGCELYQTLENADSMQFYGGTASFSVNIKALGNVNLVGIQFFYNTSEAKVTTPIGTEVSVPVTTGAMTLGQISGQAIGTAMTTSGVIGVRIRILGVSSGNPWDLNNGFIVEQAMLNSGSKGAPFCRSEVNIAGELAKCLRYYWLIGPSSNSPFATGYWSQTNQVYLAINFPAQMRTSPTIPTGTTQMLIDRPGTTQTSGSGSGSITVNSYLNSALWIIPTIGAGTVGASTMAYPNVVPIEVIAEI